MSAKSPEISVGIEDDVLRGIREVILLGVTALALFLLISLLTFDLGDPGWSNSGTGQPIHNAGGRVGAWMSDFFLAVFGVTALIFPFMIGYRGILSYTGSARRQNKWVVLMRWSGFTVAVLSSACLAYAHFVRVRIALPETTGGLLGEEFGQTLINSFGLSGATLLLLAAFLAGITLATGLSWISVIDFVGKYTLVIIGQCYGLMCACKQYFRSRFEQRHIDSSIKTPERRKPPEPRSSSRIEPVLHLSENKKPAKNKHKPMPFKGAEGDLPPVSLLDEHTVPVRRFSDSLLDDLSRQVEVILADFGVQVEVLDVLPGPVITRFEIKPAAGVKVSRISSLSKDLARALSVPSVRIVEVIPGKSVIGLEIPNEERETVSLCEVLSSREFASSSSPISLVLGKDISGQSVVADLGKMPHLLVAGTTGSGKSVAINTMILSMLYKSTPEQIRMILVDPKMLELSVYEGIPHLLTPVVTDMNEASNALRWSVQEMERRYRLMSLLGVRNLDGFNKKVREAEKQGNPIKDPTFDPAGALSEMDEAPDLTPLPNIVIVIDELADMMMIVGKKVEQLIARLAQKARAAGLHLILATQRPSVDVLTGLIKANVPTRIAFQVSSKIDSRTIIDQSGAESLLGNGDMLFLPPGTSIPIRAHGAFVDDHEVHRVVDFLKTTGHSDYLPEITQEISDDSPVSGGSGYDSESDSLYDEAVAFVTESRKASISSVQRRFKVGYNRAARMIEDMENSGVVSAAESNGSRQVLAPPPPKN